MSSAPSPPFHPHWRSTPLPKRPTTIAADVAVQTAKVLNVTKVQPIIIDKSPANSLHLLEWNGHVRAWVPALGRRREASASSRAWNRDRRVRLAPREVRHSRHTRQFIRAPRTGIPTSP